MLKRVSLIAAALAVAACLGAGSASAATLYTTSAHTTPVAVGTTFTATTPSATWSQYQGSEQWSLCQKVTNAYKVTQNSGGLFKAERTSGLFEKCQPTPAEFVGSISTLQVGGNSVTVGSNADWLGTTLANLAWKWTGTGAGFGTWSANFTGATGNPPAKGIYVQQPIVGKAPVSLVFDHAGPVLNSNFPSETLSATFTFVGTAGSWSFG